MPEKLIMGGDDLDIFIPIDLSTYGLGIDRLIEEVIDLHQKAGFDKFILTGPSKGWRKAGYPPRDEFEQIADDILKFKEGVRKYDIRTGWWNTLTLKSGPADYQRVVFIDGRECPTSTCPLDPEFQERFSGDVALVAERAEPEWIIFEDDYGLNCHGGSACFCDLHLRLFAQRIGRLYSREELQGIFREESESSASIRREWEAGIRDSLTQLAGRVRQAVDRETPWIPMGSMQPGCADQDGDSTEAVARAFAGDRHRPFIRLYGTSYCSDDPRSLPENVFHALYSKQHLPEDVICYHESDTYPHSRFFMSAGKMRSLMGAVYSYGFAGSTFQVCQHLDAPNEEAGYSEMFMKERERFQAVRQLVRHCELSGCGLLSAPKQTNYWVAAFAHFGLPYSTLESAVNVLSGVLSDSLSDRQITRLLQQGLILDGEAAERLCARGFSDDIGVTVNGYTTIDDPGRDLGSREKIRREFLPADLDGQLMMSFSTYSPYGNGRMYELQPNSPATEIVTDLVDFKNKTVGVGMTRFRNTQGGRIVIMGMSVQGNQSSSLFSYRRRRLIQDLVLWAGADDMIYVQDRPRVFCILNRSKAGSDRRMLGLVTLINLCSDTFESVELHLPPEWVGSTTVTYLDAHGKWMEAPHEFMGQTIRIDRPLLLYHPVYLRFVGLLT